MVTLSIIGCNQVEMDRGEDVQIKEKAVETLSIGSNSFALEAYLWRDFQPMSPEDGKPMISINWIICTKSNKIPDNISMVKQFVIYENEIWEANYEDEAPAPSLPAFKIEGISRNGPKWGPGIYVDIISQIHDSKTNKDYYIELKHVYVNRTD